VLLVPAFAAAQSKVAEVCPRPAVGSVVTAPQEIRSQNGVLQVALSLRSSTGSSGGTRYCYVDESGNQSPTLRLKPGDLLILKLKNELATGSATMNPAGDAQHPCISSAMAMPATSTNMHFHGLMIPPVCHQDDVLNTMIKPGAPAYEYRVRIPKTHPPGLYWYHPHPHGHSEEQVLGGASGALIVEGIETSNHLLAGLPERLLVIRDQNRPNVSPGDVPKDANGLKPPAHDLSVNFIPVPFPEYPPAIIKIRPAQRELWRVLNASADTFVDLHLLSNGKWQSMGLVSLDGVPLGYEGNGAKNRIEWKPNIPIPPGGRAEFLFDGPPEGARTQVLTAGVDTVPSIDEEDPAFVAASNNGTAIQDDDDYTPPRWLLTIVAAADAPRPDAVLPRAASRFERRAVPSLASVRPTRQRKLYFSEKVLDPKNPRTSTAFYVTEEGRRPAPFNPAAAPNITVRQGDVEDWVVENRSQEAHTFHIHQTHFIVLQRDHQAVQENYLRDTVDLPYWDGTSPHYPSVKLRLDFRDPAIVGTFPYHCHILQHEDGGMMGTIRVVKNIADKVK
jgi:FtsP/CotA-like multicopper oxidase with cupredoxin domain